MASNELREIRRYEREATIKIQSALALLADRPEGQFFLRTLLDYTQYGEVIGPGNALEMAYTNGKQSVGANLIGLLDSFSPTLYPDLLRQVRLENEERRTEKGNSHD